MKTQEALVYREVQKNTKKAMKAIDLVADKVHDKELAAHIAKQSLKYAQLYQEATGKLIDAQAEPYRESYFEEMKVKTGIQYNTLLNTSTGHIAEILIKEENNGLLDMEKVLKHNDVASLAATSLAKQLISLQEEHVKSLKDYL